MKLAIRELNKKDDTKAIQFAIKGMHFDRYVDHKLLLNLYGRYFWYSEITRATQIIAAYYGDEFAGVLLCEMKGQEKKYRSFWKSAYVKVFDFFKNIFMQEDIYEKTNQEMFQDFCSKNSPDGEILFLAANPEVKVKGIGSLLLEELSKREAGKNVYLYTDEACTYQFYEHRGFERAEMKTVDLDIINKKVSLQCFLYRKILE